MPHIAKLKGPNTPAMGESHAVTVPGFTREQTESVRILVNVVVDAIFEDYRVSPKGLNKDMRLEKEIKGPAGLLIKLEEDDREQSVVQAVNQEPSAQRGVIGDGNILRGQRSPHAGDDQDAQDINSDTTTLEQGVRRHLEQDNNASERAENISQAQAVAPSQAKPRTEGSQSSNNVVEQDLIFLKVKINNARTPATTAHILDIQRLSHMPEGRLTFQKIILTMIHFGCYGPRLGSLLQTGAFSAKIKGKAARGSKQKLFQIRKEGKDISVRCSVIC